MRKFTFVVVLVTAIIIAIAYGVFTSVLKGYYISALPAALLVVVGTTLFSFYLLEKAIASQVQRQFNSMFLMVTGGKLLFYLFGLVIYVLFQPEGAKVFLISFLLLYFVYTTILVSGILMRQKELKINKY